MAFIIETSNKYPIIKTSMLDPVEASDKVGLVLALQDLLSRRRNMSSVYLALNLNTLSLDQDVPLVQILSQFAKVYHGWRGKLQIELLAVTSPALTSVIRYIAESLSLPMHIFISYEALQTYVERRHGDTQPIPNHLLAQLSATAALDEDE